MSMQFANNIFKSEKTHPPQIQILYNTKASIITNTIKKIKSLNPTNNGILTTKVLTLIMIAKVLCHNLIRNPKTNKNNSKVRMDKEK